MTCTSCKQNLPDTARFCPYCGSAVAEPISDAQCATASEVKAPLSPMPEPACDGELEPQTCTEDENAAQQNSNETTLSQTDTPPIELHEPCAASAHGMRVREYFLCLVLFCIPVLGLIPMVAWAFSPRVCAEKRRLAQAALCLAAVILAAI